MEPLPDYCIVSPLQLRVARTMLNLTAIDLEKVMKAGGVYGSHMHFWRAEQHTRGWDDLQRKMRAVYERLGLIFYPNHMVGFREGFTPTEQHISKRVPVSVVIDALEAGKQILAEEEDRVTRETLLAQRIRGKRPERPGRRRLGRLNVSSQE